MLENPSKQIEELKDNDVQENTFQRHLIATQLQVAMINKMLPKGFKFEAYETVKRMQDQAKAAPKTLVNKRRRVADEDNKKGKADSDDSEEESISKRAKRTEQDMENKRTSQRPKKPTNFDDYVAKDQKIFKLTTSNQMLKQESKAQTPA